MLFVLNRHARAPLFVHVPAAACEPWGHLGTRKEGQSGKRRIISLSSLVLYEPWLSWKYDKATGTGLPGLRQRNCRGFMESVTDQLIGQVIAGKYKILEQIGSGAAGHVFKAEHLLLKQTVAIKFLNAEATGDGSSLKRLRQEAQTLALLHHPGIAGLREFGLTEHSVFPAYIVMEYVAGSSLATLIADGGAMPTARALCLAIGLSDALNYAHVNGVLHRDIKPGNIVVAGAGSPAEAAKLVDFGLAALAETGAGAARLTKTGDVLGTPAYMSPEQGQGKKLDGRSDVYALGCVLYEVLNGVPPFQAESGVALIVQHANEAVQFKNKSVPWTVQSVVLRALEKDPANRYQNMADLRADLELASRGERPRHGRAKLYLSPQEKKKLALNAMTVVCLALAGSMVYDMYLSGDPVKSLNWQILFHPQNTEMYMTRGRFLVKRYQYRDAIKDLDKVIALNPNHVVAYTWRAGAYNGLENWQQGLADANKAIALDPNVHQAFQFRGWSNYCLHNYSRALADGDECLRLNPKNLHNNNALIYAQRGLIYQAQGKDAQALDEAQKALAFYGPWRAGRAGSREMAQALDDRASAYCNLDRLDLAMQDASDSLKADPTRRRTYLTVCRIYNGLKQYDKALDYMTKLIGPYETWGEALAVRAQTRLGMGDKQTAIADMKKACQLEPNKVVVARIAREVKEATGVDFHVDFPFADRSPLPARQNVFRTWPKAAAGANLPSEDASR